MWHTVTFVSPSPAVLTQAGSATLGSSRAGTHRGDLQLPWEAAGAAIVSSALPLLQLIARGAGYIDLGHGQTCNPSPQCRWFLPRHEWFRRSTSLVLPHGPGVARLGTGAGIAPLPAAVAAASMAAAAARSMAVVLSSPARFVCSTPAGWSLLSWDTANMLMSKLSVRYCSPMTGDDEHSLSRAATASVAHPLPSSPAISVATPVQQQQSAVSGPRTAWCSLRSSCGRSPGRQ